MDDYEWFLRGDNLEGGKEVRKEKKGCRKGRIGCVWYGWWTKMYHKVKEKY